MQYRPAHKLDMRLKLCVFPFFRESEEARFLHHFSSRHHSRVYLFLYSTDSQAWFPIDQTIVHE